MSKALEQFDRELAQWAEAYPLSVFPEPDMAKAHEALTSMGMTLDAVSASNMRHVVTTLNRLFEPVRASLMDAPAVPVQPAPWLDYSVLHHFAQEKNVSYNQLCAAVHKALAATPAAVQPAVSAEPLYRSTLLYGGPPAAVQQGRDDRAVFEKLGREMYAMTTTVHSPSIPFAEACACIPVIWENFVQERNRHAAAELVAASQPAAQAPAVPLTSELDLTLTKDEAEYVTAFIADENTADDDVVRLMIGPGHAGYGLYAAHPEYPEEGAVFIKAAVAHGIGSASTTVEHADEDVRVIVHRRTQ